ncbi:MAG: hypothetical protein ACLUKE_17515 [Blautia wexlerae]
MSELKLVTRNIRINGIQHKASDMSEEEIKCLLIQRQDELLLSMNYERKMPPVKCGERRTSMHK